MELSYIQEQFADLILPGRTMAGGTMAYRLRLPDFPLGREFSWAEIRIPRGFPDKAKAYITVSQDAVLRIPHIDRDGDLCNDSEPGPGLGYSPEDRILSLLYGFRSQFLTPWLSGELDNHFEAEALNYWVIEVARHRAHGNPISAVWTVDPCPARATVRNGVLLLPNQIVIAADEQLPITNRLLDSLNKGKSQRIGVLIADIPIAHTLTPQTWPRTTRALHQILRGRLPSDTYRKFASESSRRGRGVHRVVLLRTKDFSFAYLLPGGPATAVGPEKRRKTYPCPRVPLPLTTNRLDPAWTVGRDQHPEVAERQSKHALVLGAGALGSSVVDQLAKAGIGFISVVDDDFVSSANICRHLLGTDSIGRKKAEAVAQRVKLGYPSTAVVPYTMTTQQWLSQHTLAEVDMVIDLTGEPDVRWQIEQARKASSTPLLIGWMEPYVAAAHVCVLPAGIDWMQDGRDRLTALEAVTWPDEVIRQEPGCSSRFQSYTAAAATHAVALIAEKAIDLIDGQLACKAPHVASWVRGQDFLDKHWHGLVHREWAKPASSQAGMILMRPLT
nr:ThiF family adenylyltransferase [Pseudomonas aeruginosa]